MNLEIRDVEEGSILLPWFNFLVVSAETEEPKAAFVDREEAELYLQQVHGIVDYEERRKCNPCS